MVRMAVWVPLSQNPVQGDFEAGRLIIQRVSVEALASGSVEARSQITVAEGATELKETADHPPTGIHHSCRFLEVRAGVAEPPATRLEAVAAERFLLRVQTL